MDKIKTKTLVLNYFDQIFLLIKNHNLDKIIMTKILENKLKNIILIAILFSSSWTYAQIAVPSLFSENRSINPAAISSRKAGQMTGIVSTENLVREQDHGPVFGAGSVVKTDTTLNRASYFRGGKGGGFTTEFQVEAVTGEVETEVEGVQATASSDSSSTIMFSYAMGFSKGFGLSLCAVNFTRDYAQTVDSGGTEYNFTEETNATFTSIKPGWIWGDSLRLGFFVDLIMQSGTMDSTEQSSDATYNSSTSDTLQGMFPIGGIGIGMIGSSFQFEFAYEAPLIDPDSVAPEGAEVE